MRRLKRRLRRTLMQARVLFGGNRHALVGEASLWRLKRDFQITFLKEHGLRPDHVVLDVGCGTLRGGIPLISYLDAGNYFGTEVRSEVLQQARKELSKSDLVGKRPTLLMSDMTQLRLDRPVDFAWAFSVLIHMTDEVLERCLASVSNALAPDGAFYANVNLGEGALGEWQGFPVQRRSMAFYETSAKSSLLTVEDIGALGDLGHRSGRPLQDAQRMLVFRRAHGQPFD